MAWYENSFSNMSLLPSNKLSTSPADWQQFHVMEQPAVRIGYNSALYKVGCMKGLVVSFLVAISCRINIGMQTLLINPPLCKD
jgi:hypothetical protein